MPAVSPHQITVVFKHPRPETRLVVGLEFDLMEGVILGSHHHVGAVVRNARLFGGYVLGDLAAKEPAADNPVARAQKQRL